MVWYLMISYDSIAWYYMLLRCWLRCAGCVSQDAYILHNKVYNKDYIYHQLLFQAVTIIFSLMAITLVVLLSTLGKCQQQTQLQHERTILMLLLLSEWSYILKAEVPDFLLFFAKFQATFSQCHFVIKLLGVIMSWALLPWALAYLYFMWWRPAHHLEQVFPSTSLSLASEFE